MSFRSSDFSSATSEIKQHNMKIVNTWYSGLLKRPLDRTSEEIERASAHLRDMSATEKFHHCLLQQMALYARYDRLDEGVLVIRQGDHGVNWYLVLSGSLAVYTSENIRLKGGPKLCTLTSGASFGEGIFTCNPHHVSVITVDKAELLWMDYKDMKLLWERHREMMDAAITSLENLPNLNDEMKKLLMLRDPVTFDDNLNPASPICAEPSGNLSHAAWVLRTILLGHHGHMIRDRKYHLRTYKRCLVGSELVDWILDTFPKVDNREHAAGMGQALLEEGVLVHVCKQHPFLDQYLFYRFMEDEASPGPMPTEADLERAQEDLFDVFTLLAQASPDATLRVILRKVPEERTCDDVEIVFEELLQIKSLQHLSCTVKRELASVIMFEAHSHAGTVLFNQGDEGRSWYIVAKGSVNVSIHGKGVVCVLGEADDFGKLALVNDAPRAATITLAEDNCHFLRVDKDDFNRILRDVEANTVRLKEHGQDVLILEKIPIPVDTNGSFHSEYKYSVMAGTPEKMLEYLLETAMDPKKEHQTAGTFLDDFLLTHSIFFPDEKLSEAITNQYPLWGP
ncbi:Rap guanine nucleotide exchange factor 4 [Elysia marginata]|uniref:Rap guanine nucleotide exchange factor 4 n=1 Tax=Elysia marginata TaxID=1093978 RepID=A0AAV4ECZ9_9GAST|nr:Rap guanine nucleotide exchange factor 4 [Elysia marginata]